MRDNPILRVTAKILFAPIIVFGLYVQFHGDYGPGGGFQAGVIIAAAFILHALIFGLEAGRRLVPAWANLVMLAGGVIVYGAVGVAGMMLDGLFLDYNVLAYDASKGQHYGILLVEFGVGLTVTGVMLALFHAFAGFAEAHTDVRILAPMMFGMNFTTFYFGPAMSLYPDQPAPNEAPPVSMRRRALQAATSTPQASLVDPPIEATNLPPPLPRPSRLR